MAFVHLHNHTEHSLCEGVMSVDDMVRRAAELDMRAIADAVDVADAMKPFYNFKAS